MDHINKIQISYKYLETCSGGKWLTYNFQFHRQLGCSENCVTLSADDLNVASEKHDIPECRRLQTPLVHAHPKIAL